MAILSIGAVYATQSKLLQRIYIPDTNNLSEITKQPVLPGETLIILSFATYQQGGAPAIQSAIGAPTFSGVCAVVDGTSTVIDKVMADPTLYTDARGQIVPSDAAMPGDKWDGTQFTRSYAEYVPITGVVTNISMQPILNPVPQNALNLLIVTPPGLQVGQVVPKIANKSV